MQFTHVDGNQQGRVKIYTLSTCGWCKKTKALLREIGVAYDYLDVDTLDDDDAEEAIAEIDKWNPSRSFPTMIIDGEECIVGFQEERIRSILE